MARVFDADGGVVGRIATRAAKSLLNGDHVIIVNSDKAIITGSPQRILEHYAHRRARGSQRKGPFFPRRPDRIMRRAVRGMLPRKTPRGRAAYSRLKVHVGLPASLSKKSDTFEKVITRHGHAKSIVLGDLSKLLGSEF